MKNFTVKDLTLNAIYGSIYFVFVLIFSFLSFEAIQFRIAEVLLIFVLFNPKITPGLILGTFLANLTSPFGIVDALVGTLASLIAIILMIITRKIPLLAMLFPALSNGIIVGIMISYLSKTPFLVNFGLVFLGEFVVMYIIGLPLYYYFKKNQDLLEIIT